MRDIQALLEALRLPSPPNESAVLSELKRKGFIRPRAAQPPWSVTPEGHWRITGFLGTIDPAAAEFEMTQHPGAEFAHARQVILPPLLAPPKWLAPISRLLTKFPFDKNVFCMTRFADDLADPVAKAAAAARKALAAHGLVLHLANDRTVEEELFGNVAAYMWSCRYGIAFLEDRAGRGLNENVLIEAGAMLMAGRRSALFKDSALQRTLPTDLVGHIYKKVDLSDAEGVTRQVHRWVAIDLELGSCGDCPKSVAGALST